MQLVLHVIPFVSGSVKYTQAAPASAITAYSQNVPEPPTCCTKVRKVWLTNALVTQLQVAAAPPPNPRNCTHTDMHTETTLKHLWKVTNSFS